MISDKYDITRDGPLNGMPLIDMLKLARTRGVQYPKMKFKIGEEKVMVSLAGNGRIYITDAKPFAERTRFAEIREQGEVTLNHQKLSAAILGHIVALIRDPAGTVDAWGKESGICCFCWRYLTAKESVKRGYGPICAHKHGLPYE